MKFSNQLTGIINFLTLLLSIPIIGAGIWLATKHSTDCVRFLQWPVIIIGVFILLVSIAGFVGSCCRVAWLLWVYSLVMFLLIILLFAFTIFAFVVTNPGAGHALSGKGYKEYRLGDYSTWLQSRVDNNNNWRKIMSCLSDAKICQDLSKYSSEGVFNMADLSSFQDVASPLLLVDTPSRMQPFGITPQIQLLILIAQGGATIKPSSASIAIPVGQECFRT
ncbi:hypothetical protein O6H91_06G000600 [Diphasiastrum complanatum]|uniref:Uncharacterized protein n=1 Tax=Diphasiastrum complanatum TaxID=34168 RepID=A0ACC2DA47_DIPCM|nr:hypothetical protein O6H91_06G000600 [Diphasiastrum complanatum]